jgi:hypothetical protein
VSELRLLEFFRFYDHGNPYHRAAIAQLQEQLTDELLSRNHEWFKTWSQAGKYDPTQSSDHQVST